MYGNVLPAQDKWDKLLLALKVPDWEIKSMKKNNFHQTDDCLMDGLSYWLKGNTKTEDPNAPDVNWKSMLAALKDAVGQRGLADTIKEKLRKSIAK